MDIYTVADLIAEIQGQLVDPDLTPEDRTYYEDLLELISNLPSDPPAPPVDAALAVSLTEIKQHLRIDGTSSDADLTAKIKAATQYIEQETWTTVAFNWFVATLDGFPADRVITLPKPPLVDVAAIQYYDTAGALQTLPPTAYRVNAAAKPGRVICRGNANWPSTEAAADAVRVLYSAGSTNVPELLKQAVKLLVGHWYENREGATDRRIESVPMAVESIIAMHRFF